MANLTFPSVATLDASTFKEAVEDPAIAPSQMDGGYVISRPRFTRTPRRTFSFSFNMMSDTDKTSLETFWQTGSLGTSNAFLWTHPASGEVINVRFANGTKLEFDAIVPAAKIWKTSLLNLQEI